jgi:hypothetical protein
MELRAVVLARIEWTAIGVFGVRTGLIAFHRATEANRLRTASLPFFNTSKNI